VPEYKIENHALHSHRDVQEKRNEGKNRREHKIVNEKA